MTFASFVYQDKKRIENVQQVYQMYLQKPYRKGMQIKSDKGVAMYV